MMVGSFFERSCNPTQLDVISDALDMLVKLAKLPVVSTPTYTEQWFYRVHKLASTCLLALSWRGASKDDHDDFKDDFKVITTLFDKGVCMQLSINTRLMFNLLLVCTGSLPVFAQILHRTTSLVNHAPAQAVNNSEHGDPGQQTARDIEDARRVLWTFYTYVMQCSRGQRVVLIHAGIIPSLLQVSFINNKPAAVLTICISSSTNVASPKSMASPAWYLASWFLWGATISPLALKFCVHSSNTIRARGSVSFKLLFLLSYPTVRMQEAKSDCVCSLN
jgi:hypothetical protein